MAIEVGRSLARPNNGTRTSDGFSLRIGMEGEICAYGTGQVVVSGLRGQRAGRWCRRRATGCVTRGLAEWVRRGRRGGGDGAGSDTQGFGCGNVRDMRLRMVWWAGLFGKTDRSHNWMPRPGGGVVVGGDLGDLTTTTSGSVCLPGSLPRDGQHLVTPTRRIYGK